MKAVAAEEVEHREPSRQEKLMEAVPLSHSTRKRAEESMAPRVEEYGHSNEAVSKDRQQPINKST